MSLKIQADEMFLKRKRHQTVVKFQHEGPVHKADVFELLDTYPKVLITSMSGQSPLLLVKFLGNYYCNTSSRYQDVSDRHYQCHWKHINNQMKDFEDYLEVAYWITIPAHIPSRFYCQLSRPSIDIKIATGEVVTYTVTRERLSYDIYAKISDKRLIFLHSTSKDYYDTEDGGMNYELFAACTLDYKSVSCLIDFSNITITPGPADSVRDIQTAVDQVMFHPDAIQRRIAYYAGPHADLYAQRDAALQPLPLPVIKQLTPRMKEVADVCQMNELQAMFSSHTLQPLRVMAKEMGIKATGTKKELCAELAAHWKIMGYNVPI